MFATLDLTWKPSAAQATPPVGKAPAIVREDTYVHVIRVTDGWVDNLQDLAWAAQLRRKRLTGVTTDDPLAEFAITKTQDGDDLLVTLRLESDVTVLLPTDSFWDMQADGTDRTTLLAGKVKVLDDATRVA